MEVKTSPMGFVINSDDVVHETLDGEVVVVNLKMGHYYSLTDAGALIWAGLQQSLSAHALSGLLLESYDVEQDQALGAVETFLTELVSEGLLSEGPVLEQHETLAGHTRDRLKFHPPVLARHEDMEGLLLLDPVHDVAAEGWPTVAS